MAATVEDVLSYIGGAGTADETDVESALPVAVSLIDSYVGENAVVPENVLDRAVVAVAAELYFQSQSPGGLTNFASEYGNTAVRTNRDPLRPAYGLLKPFLPLGFS